MSRSAHDATRFTSTTPHASSIPRSPTRIPPRSQAQQRQKGPVAPTGETPLEKVRRLRAAADAARDAQVSTFEKLIVRGRRWADIAHRTTTLFLIGATFVAGGVTVYALGDMMVYNRKKRAQFFEEQKAVHQNAIHRARQAIADGVASEKDIDFIRIEDEHAARLAEAAKLKAEKKGIFKRAKELLFYGLKNDEDGDEKPLETLLSDQVEGGSSEKHTDILKGLEEKKSEFTDKARQAFANEKERERLGGPLDRLGSPAKSGETEQPKSGGWTSFMTRR